MDNKALLDMLMGKDRNLTASQKSAHQLHYTDSTICKYYTVDYCPHELFTNTKADIGICENVHDNVCKQQFHNESNQSIKLTYYQSFYSYISTIVHDCNKLVDRNKSRAEREYNEWLQQHKQQADIQANHNHAVKHIDAHKLDELQLQLAEQTNRLQTINTQIASLLSEIDQIGSDGDIGIIDEKMQFIDTLQSQHQSIQLQIDAINQQIANESATFTNNDTISHSGSNNNNCTSISHSTRLTYRKTIVCDICSSQFLENETQDRVDAHMNGRIHNGYKQLRDSLVQYKQLIHELQQNIDNENNSISNNNHITTTCNDIIEPSKLSGPTDKSSSRSRDRDYQHSRSHSRHRYDDPSYSGHHRYSHDRSYHANDRYNNSRYNHDRRYDSHSSGSRRYDRYEQHDKYVHDYSPVRQRSRQQ